MAEVALMTTLAVAAVALVSFFVQDWINQAGARAEQPETVYRYSPARYCLAGGNTGRTAAVVQNEADTHSGPLPDHPSRVHAFTLSRSLDEREWKADFNGDGRADTIIDRDGGLRFYLHGQLNPNNRRDLFNPPSDVIAFAGSHKPPTLRWERLTGLHDPLGKNPAAVYILPARVYEALAGTSDVGVFSNGLGARPGGLNFNSAGFEEITEERLRLWQAAPVPAAYDLPANRDSPSARYVDLPAERGIDGEGIAFAWDIRINDAGRCWTLTGPARDASESP